jgi:peroxiredoxin Q/BCP
MKALFTSLAICASAFVAVAQEGPNLKLGLKLGDPIPSVQVKDQDGAAVNLAEEGKAGYTLVFFYPRALTRGCTAQACSLRDAYEELQAKGVKVFGASTDAPEKQKEFITVNSLPYRLLADTDKKVIEAFGVPLMNLGSDSAASRQAYLFKDGKLVWMDPKASTAKQAEDVLGAIAKLAD